MVINQLACQLGQERLSHGVVIGIANRPCGRPHPRLRPSLAKGERRVLANAVAFVHHAALISRGQRAAAAMLKASMMRLIYRLVPMAQPMILRDQTSRTIAS